MDLPSLARVPHLETRKLLSIWHELDDRDELTEDQAIAAPTIEAEIKDRTSTSGSEPREEPAGTSLDRVERSETLETSEQWGSEGSKNGGENGSGPPELPDCADHWWNLVCDHDGWVEPVANKCKRRTCPSCAHDRYVRLMDEYEPLNGHVLRGKLLTVTLQRGPNPGHLVERIVQSFKRLRRREVMDPVRGGFYAIEVKPPNGDGEWFVHLHALIDAPYIPQEDLADEWEDITGDSRIVDIRELNNPDAGVRYVLGYTTKGEKIERDWADEPEEIREEFEQAVKGRRLLQPWGELYDVERDEHELHCRMCQTRAENKGEEPPAPSWSIAEFDPMLKEQLGLSWGRHPDDGEPPNEQRTLQNEPAEAIA